MKNKNYFQYIQWLGICFICGLLFDFNTESHAFNGDTHRYVTETSFENIAEICSKVNCFKISDRDYWKVVKDYSLKPDEDEIEGAFKNHFYNPVTETNFMGEKVSACTKCVDHYNKAIEYYQKNNKNLAYQELGRAIHFMEDLNTPVHTGYDLPTDAIFKFPLHVRFEKICDTINKECRCVMSFESLKYFYENDVISLAKSSSLLSSDNFYYLNEEILNPEVIAKNSVKNAQYNVTGILYKFFVKINNL